MESKLIKNGENFSFLINGKEYPPMAYITYFEENNDYEKFNVIGMKLYSVTISLAYKPINSGTGFTPFFGGVFDNKGKPDYTCVNEAFDRVLDICPDAYIFPRVYITMPDWWIEENPEEVIETRATGLRENLCSDKFREDAAVLLKYLIDYIENSKYSERIFAYQLSGGNTQEWFHFDLNGAYCENNLKYFNKYLVSKNLSKVNELPSLDEFNSNKKIEDPVLIKYLEFSNEAIADTIEFFCKKTKEFINYKKIVGTFYGYLLEVASPLWGTHKLSKLLDSENIDFFSSPNSYNGTRSLGTEWGDMMPCESIKLHGKLPFIECDIRTHLTKYPGDSRKGCDVNGIYRVPVFKGPETESLSIAAINKSFARQITHNNGIWWFDMFGHWYASDALMKVIKNTVEEYENIKLSSNLFNTEVAVFLDENLSCCYGNQNPIVGAGYRLREILAKSGVPFDIFVTSDFQTLSVKKNNYKAFIFVTSENELSAHELIYCQNNDIKYILFNGINNKPDYKEIKSFFINSGVHVYLDTEDVFYIGNGFLSVHSSESGLKKVKLPYKANVSEMGERSEFSFYMEKHETKIFKIKR